MEMLLGITEEHSLAGCAISIKLVDISPAHPVFLENLVDGGSPSGDPFSLMGGPEDETVPVEGA
jgi:hypothetical protein